MNILLYSFIKNKNTMSLQNNIGKLENIYMGAMFSGKTSSLIRYLTIKADVGFKVIYVNSILDTRSNIGYSTHNSSGHNISSKIKTISVKFLSEVDVSNYDVIGVDEFQFYKDQSPSGVVRSWVLKMGKMVSVSSLDGDYNINIFGDVYNLIPLCEPGGLFKLKDGICTMCLKKKKKIVSGGFTKRITSLTESGSKLNDIIDIGGKDKYMIVCLKCHQT